MNIKQINEMCQNTLVENLGIEFIDYTATSVTAKMQVNRKTSQPMGYLHGGASLALAETVGSAGSLFIIDAEKYHVFGMNVSANHISSIRSGWVFATAAIIHKGRSSHVWTVNITDENGKLISTASVTNAIVAKRK